MSQRILPLEQMDSVPQSGTIQCQLEHKNPHRSMAIYLDMYCLIKIGGKMQQLHVRLEGDLQDNVSTLDKGDERWNSLSSRSRHCDSVKCDDSEDTTMRKCSLYTKTQRTTHLIAFTWKFLLGLDHTLDRTQHGIQLHVGNFQNSVAYTFKLQVFDPQLISFRPWQAKI